MTRTRGGYSGLRAGLTIEQKLRQMRAMKNALATLVDTCADPAQRSCPILEALDDEAVPARERVPS